MNIVRKIPALPVWNFHCSITRRGSLFLSTGIEYDAEGGMIVFLGFFFSSGEEEEEEYTGKKIMEDDKGKNRGGAGLEDG